MTSLCYFPGVEKDEVTCGTLACHIGKNTRNAVWVFGAIVERIMNMRCLEHITRTGKRRIREAYHDKSRTSGHRPMM
jgi:hypothetical protein